MYKENIFLYRSFIVFHKYPIHTVSHLVFLLTITWISFITGYLLNMLIRFIPDTFRIKYISQRMQTSTFPQHRGVSLNSKQDENGVRFYIMGFPSFQGILSNTSRENMAMREQDE